MDLNEIKTYLDSPNPQNRIKAIVELRKHTPDDVVPLLKQRMYDQEFVIRSFVAMGLGYKRNEEGFQSLINIIENDRDPNVKAEAANSLAKYGQESIPYLLDLFKNDSHWLIRQSIFAALEDVDSPEILYKLCSWGLQGEDLVVKMVSTAKLGKLSGTAYEEKAVNLLFELSTAEQVQIRIQVAKALGFFDHPQAEAALAELRHDSDYRVVGATLEKTLK